jgi:hypothetical protein
MMLAILATDIFSTKLDINQLLYLAVLVSAVALFYFKSDKDISIKLAVHDQEIASLFKLLNSVTSELRQITGELHSISIELAKKTTNPRRNKL